MKVLSLFDGMSCGQIALQRAGIEVEAYYASEIDKHAIKVTQANFPNTIQLGDVVNINAESLPPIDLLMGGSPCQGFALGGLKENFADPRSKLFFEFVRLKEELKPKWFLLENVKMKKEWEQEITKYMGVEPMKNNSSLVSPQFRERLYWTNIPVDGSPQDRGLVLRDIVEGKNGHLALTFSHFSPPFTRSQMVDGRLYYVKEQKPSPSKNGLIFAGGVIKTTNKQWVDDGTYNQKSFSMGNRVYDWNGKSTTLQANSGGLGGKTGLYQMDDIVRKLTRVECERLQTIPDGYTNSVSFSQAVKMLGNGWTVDIIVHILKHIKKGEENG